MKLFFAFLLICSSLSTSYAQTEEVNWLTWNEAMEYYEEEPKMLYIDLYTDWCGWCKHMDNTTLKNKEVVNTLNEHFYPIKFNAEQKETIQFNGTEFIFIDNGFRGYHELALSLTNGELGYPNFVILDEEFSRVLVSPGFKESSAVMNELHFAIEEGYKRMSYDDFVKTRSKNEKK